MDGKCSLKIINLRATTSRSIESGYAVPRSLTHNKNNLKPPRSMGMIHICKDASPKADYRNVIGGIHGPKLTLLPTLCTSLA